MTCERYWREGIVLVEHGQADPHRDGCADCTRAHAARQELIDALPLVGAGETGDPRWQAKVWARIREQRPRRWRGWQWQLSGVLAAACFLVLWTRIERPPPERDLVAFEIIERGEARRGKSAHAGDLSAHVDDQLRVKVGQRSDVWIYRDNLLLRACRARVASTGCALDANGMIVDLPLSESGLYRVIVVEVPGSLELKGVLDRDRAALESVGLSYEEKRLSVR